MHAQRPVKSLYGKSVYGPRDLETQSARELETAYCKPHWAISNSSDMQLKCMQSSLAFPRNGELVQAATEAHNDFKAQILWLSK